MPLSANLVSSQRQPLFPVSFLCIFQQAYFNKYTKFDANHGILSGLFLFLLYLADRFLVLFWLCRILL